MSSEKLQQKQKVGLSLASGLAGTAVAKFLGSAALTSIGVGAAIAVPLLFFWAKKDSGDGPPPPPETSPSL